MREIKFRAWDKERKEWVKQTGNPYIFPFEGRVAMICAGSSTGHISDEDYSEYYELLQYTGLKDKNGTEIYEGDVVKLDSWEGVQQIVFIEGAFCLADKHGLYVGDIHYINHADKNQATIIGNVRENPELLKEAGA